MPLCTCEPVQTCNPTQLLPVARRRREFMMGAVLKDAPGGYGGKTLLTR